MHIMLQLHVHVKAFFPLSDVFLKYAVSVSVSNLFVE